MDQHDSRTLQGYQILGQAELSRGHLAEAADAWKHVLADKFDPTMAAETAEMLTEAAGRIYARGTGPVQTRAWPKRRATRPGGRWHRNALPRRADNGRR